MVSREQRSPLGGTLTGSGASPMMATGKGEHGKRTSPPQTSQAMSWQATSWAKQVTGLDLPEKFLLMILADYADPETWECWPSQMKLAQHMERTDRTVRYCLAKLKGACIIEEVRRGNQHRPTVYRLLGQVAYYHTQAAPETRFLSSSANTNEHRKPISKSTGNGFPPRRPVEETLHDDDDSFARLFSSPPPGLRSPIKSAGPYLRRLKANGDLPSQLDEGDVRRVLEILVAALQEGFTPPRRLPVFTLPYPPDLPALARLRDGLEASPFKGGRLRRIVSQFCRDLGEDYRPETTLTVLAHHPDEFIQFLASSAIPQG